MAACYLGGEAQTELMKNLKDSARIFEEVAEKLLAVEDKI